jgi:CubicO group peptidase (beta-lactamase class C family)
MKQTACVIIILSLVIISGTFGQNIEDDPRLKDVLNLAEKWIEAQQTYNQIPGISMALVYKQNVIWRYALGVSDMASQSKTTTRTIYSICSISKLFTSIALMQLRDQGLLRLDDPIEKHLPWYTLEQSYDQSAPITIQALLTHSSGLPRESDYPYWNAPLFNFPSRDKMIEQLKNQKTLYCADTYYQYSNLGLTLAGEIVTEVSGKDFKTYVTENIIKPLDLKDTRPEMPEDLWGKQLAIGYSSKTREGRRNKLPFFQANAITPAAGFSSTAEDLAQFAAWQLRLLETNQTEILQANTLREMHRAHWLESDWKTARGLGFGVYKNGDRSYVGHYGSCPGYRSGVLLNTQNQLAVIFMANASGIPVGNYIYGMFNLVIPVLTQVLDSPGKGKELESSLLKFTGTYSNYPWGGEVAVFPWKGGLAFADLPSDDPPLEPTKLLHVEGNRFVRIRKDGDKGEEIEFIIGEDGKVKSMKQHSNYWPRINIQ